MNKIFEIPGIPAPIELIRSSRKTLGVQLAADGHIIARAPLKMAECDVRAFIIKNQQWIEKQLVKVEQSQQRLEAAGAFTREEIEDMAKKALEVIPGRVAHYAALLGVTYGRITIRNQKTKWGSCTSKGNLNFNCLLMAAPPEVLDSVVVHELCHRLHMDHSKAFYAEVYRVFPEYDRWNKWLRANGGLLIRRMTAGK